MALEYGHRTEPPKEREQPDRETEPVVLAGMSEAIYAELDALLALPLQASIDDPDADEQVRTLARTALEDSRRAWRQLAYAIAAGVVTHLRSNLEIVGAGTSTTATVRVSGSTAAAGEHQHGAGNLSVELAGLEFR